MPALEVDEEPLPAGWEVAMSRSKNMPYYYHARSNKVYWVDNALPRGWAHQFDSKGVVFYFHIRDKNATLTYDKPVLRSPATAGDGGASPEPLPVPAPSYSAPVERRERRDSGSTSDPSRRDSPMARSRSGSGASPAPPGRTLERKKSNSLMDLLSPGPPALAHDRSPEREETPKTTARPMDIANLVTPSATTFSAASGTKRTFDELTKDEDPDAAAQFYGNLQRNAMSDRADSLLFHMRAMNNWVKSILINEFAKRDDRVLDLACGKGGDLMKWAKRSISKYVGVDIAQKSLEDAVDRFSSNGHHHRELDVQFIQGDLGKVSLLEDVLHCWTRDAGWHEAVPSLERAFFNIVSIQFSFHYMFGEEQRASRFFRTVHDLLVDGGTLIATTVDPNKVLMKYYQNLGPDSENVDAAQGQLQRPDISIVDNKQREVCAIRFDDETRSLLTGYNVRPEGAFGLRYNFTLRDTTDTEGGGAMGGGEAVDLPEYLVCDDVLKRMLKEHGFELLLQQNFHHFVTTNKDKRENRMLLEKMHVMNVDGTLSDAEWEIAGLYQVLAFKKAY